MSHEKEKQPLTFHYTDCLINRDPEIMVYYNPQITG